MKLKTVLTATVLLALLSTGSYALYRHWLPAWGQRETFAPPREFFQVVFWDTAGKEHVLQEFRQQSFLVINFWATWCLPCRETLPEIAQAQQRWNKQGVDFVAVAVDTPAHMIPFMQNQPPFAYPVVMGEEAGLVLLPLLGNVSRTLPYTLVLDHKGMIRYRKLGNISAKQLDDVLNSLRFGTL